MFWNIVLGFIIWIIGAAILATILGRFISVRKEQDYE